MATGIDFSELSYSELKRTYLQNIQLRSISECELCLSVISALELVRPSEIEHAGERITTRDLTATRERAEKQRGILLMSSRGQEVIVPGPLREGY